VTKLRALADLGALREVLQRREREAAEQAARERAARAAAERQRRLFADAVGPVTPLPRDERAQSTLPRPTPEPRQRLLDEQAALKEALSDEVDIESLLLTDDGLSFRRAGVGPDVVTRLRRGHWAIQAEIDLHGLRRDEARDELSAFVRHAAMRGQRCLRVVHGKGHGSPGRQPVLKGKVQRWLGQSADVIAFAQASGPQGGAGALIVLLAGSVNASSSRRGSGFAGPPAAPP
jgi:DNA-nicking Smr family endonuclease